MDITPEWNVARPENRLVRAHLLTFSAICISTTCAMEGARPHDSKDAPTTIVEGPIVNEKRKNQTYKNLFVNIKLVLTHKREVAAPNQALFQKQHSLSISQVNERV